MKKDLSDRFFPAETCVLINLLFIINIPYSSICVHYAAEMMEVTDEVGLLCILVGAGDR